MVGLADGSVATLSIQLESKELKDLKIFPLGVTPVSLNVTQVDGKRMVFASGSRTAVFYWERQRLMQSVVMMKVREKPCPNLLIAEYGNTIGCGGWNELKYDALPVVPAFGYVDVIIHWPDSWDR